MEALAVEVRRLVYTVICFQCLLQLTEGSAYQKYLKLFSYLLTMYICCNVIFSFAGQVESSFSEADKLYAEWEKEWRAMTETERIYEGGVSYEEKLWDDKIMNEAYSEYNSRKESAEDAGKDYGHTEEDD